MIKEIIVVEGTHDKSKLIEVFGNIDIITTNGSALNEETISLIQKAQKERGVILFLDPDGPGEQIRSRISEQVPGCKHAYIDKQLAKTTKKVGIEHASTDDILKSFENIYSLKEGTQNIDYSDLTELGLTDVVNSTKRREFVSTKLNIGKTNAKQFINRVNMFDISLDKIKKILGDYIEH